MKADARIQLHAPLQAMTIVDGDVEQANRHLLDVRSEDAYRRGLADGRQRATEDASETIARAIEALEVAQREFESGLEAYEVELRDFSIRFSVEIARHLLRNEIDAGRYDLDRIVRETLAQAEVGRGKCTVHLSPQDYSLLDPGSFRSGTQIEEDPTVSRGDVHITTPLGLFVRDLDTQLASIAERIAEVEA
jgi:flagellar biosynthesis/type III secretory pathway protein FliH